MPTGVVKSGPHLQIIGNNLFYIFNSYKRMGASTNKSIHTRSCRELKGLETLSYALDFFNDKSRYQSKENLRILPMWEQRSG
jgi:hypothetical protein